MVSPFQVEYGHENIPWIAEAGVDVGEGDGEGDICGGWLGSGDVLVPRIQTAKYLGKYSM